VADLSSIDQSWLRWGLDSLGAIALAAWGIIQKKIGMLEKKHDEFGRSMLESVAAARTKLENSQDIISRDLWQALETERQANQRFREQMLRESATRQDLENQIRDLKKDIAGMLDIHFAKR
jgi:hypothetical protein